MAADAALPARSRPLFYGWVVVACSAAVSAITMALAGFNFGLFIRPMGDDLGISRATFGWAMAVRQVASAVTSPMLGRWIDRRGARSLLVVATIVTCASMAGLSLVTTGWQLIVLFVLMGLLGMMGPGALAVTVPIAKWFVVKRGRAMSYVSIGAPVGAVIFIPMTQLLIDQFGWENTWRILAVFGMLTVLPLAYFIRRQPEDMGLLPDGLTAAEAAAERTRTAGVVEVAWTAGQAVHSFTFWRLVAVFSLVMLGMGSVGLHRIPHFTDQGISPGLVSLAISVDAIAATASTFLMGGLVTRFPAHYVGAVGFLLLSGAVYLTIIASNPALMFLSMAVFGFGAGGMILLQNFLWADYFGRAHVGAIRGAGMPIMMLFSAAGPPVAGYVQDFTGSYNPIWWAGAALMFAGAIILLVTPPPRRGPREAVDVGHPGSAPAPAP
jgi:MFS family permease